MVDSKHLERPTKVPNVTTDALVLRPKGKDKEESHDILLITRLKDPFKDHLAYPGGFVDYNEDPKDACLRELKEECGIEGHSAELVTVAGHPKRDPRKHIISVVYHVQVSPDCKVKAGDDASKAEWYDLKQVWENKDDQLKLAFDHKEILREFLQKFHPYYL